uniref:Mediator of RNA polymerase II transcription subunit 17 n=1 Tax=Anthurium amnicola TaxID=1678845 RepID=A0A1D1YSZ6_9ARAE
MMLSRQIRTNMICGFESPPSRRNEFTVILVSCFHHGVASGPTITLTHVAQMVVLQVDHVDAGISLENILHSVWNAASRMHDSAIMKRINLLQSRQEMKVDLIVKDQVTYLEDWALLEREHSSSLLLAIEALTASTLQLPIIGGARADIHAVKDAISSAVDVMQAMGSSICHLLSMVEGTNSVVSELAGVAAQERAMIAECRELLASTAAVQVQESSVRTHLLQMRRDLIRPEQLISTMRM